MLFDDEIYMFNKNHLRFSSVVFQNLQEIISDSVQGPGRARTFGVKAPPKAPMLSGRAYLTNHRLILLSAEKQRGKRFDKLTTCHNVFVIFHTDLPV